MYHLSSWFLTCVKHFLALLHNDEVFQRPLLSDSQISADAPCCTCPVVSLRCFCGLLYCSLTRWLYMEVSSRSSNTTCNTWSKSSSNNSSSSVTLPQSLRPSSPYLPWTQQIPVSMSSHISHSAASLAVLKTLLLSLSTSYGTVGATEYSKTSMTYLSLRR